MDPRVVIGASQERAVPAVQVRAASHVPVRAAGGRDGAPVARAAYAPVVAPRADPLAAALARCVDARVLARWHEINPGAYATGAPPLNAIGSPFAWQDESLTVQPRPGQLPGRGIRYVQHTPAAPNLVVSADNTIAMQKAAGQAKDAYIEAGARAVANAALAAKGSPIKLGRTGHTITVNAHQGAPQRTLQKVRPEVRAAQHGAAQLNAADFPTLAAVICRDLAESVLGGRMTHIRLRDPAGNVRDVAADTSDPNIVTGSQQLAQAVANRKISLAQAAAKMALANVPQPSKAYGKATRKKRFAQRTRGLGINEHAWARAGEAYVIQSTYGKAGDNKNYSDPLEPAVVGGFGYHFGAVVAESTDRRDAITLENYRRTGEVDSAAIALLNDLRVRFAHNLVAALSNIHGVRLTPKEEVGAILHYLETNSAPTFNQAYAKWGQLLGEGVTPGALWYFRMVGRDDPAQSFHRQCAPGGWYVSPITFVMTN